jgi:arylsulfatase A-like enzyme
MTCETTQPINDFPRHSALTRVMSFIFLVASLATAQAGESGGSASNNPINVLFIAIDDLRPELGAYGHANMSTPTIDRLASQGVLFTRAYDNVPVCGASRASMLSGLRPTPQRFLDFGTRLDEDAPSALTLPAYLRQHGYVTLSLGKVLHHQDDALYSWSEPPWFPENRDPGYSSWRNYVLPENIAADKARQQGRQPPPFEAADVADDAYFDGQIAIRAVDELERLAKKEQPFFLAVGFVKPHLPFNAPRRYWDLYPLNEITTTDNPLFPANAPQQAMHNWGELRRYDGIPDNKEPVPNEMARKLVQGYRAATSYTDAQVGRVLEALERLDLSGSTLVVLWGDHGWSLGDHGLWAKHSPFNVANRIPLVVRGPGVTAGTTSERLVESVDIYPTITELLSLPPPEHLEGESFRTALTAATAAGKEAVFPRWKNSDSIRTERYYYTEWRNPGGEIIARMLYDHAVDPDERSNVAEEPGYADIVASLSARLRKHLATISE